MQIHLLDRKSILTIDILSSGGGVIKRYEAEFYDSKSSLSLTVSSDELFELCNKRGEFFNANVSFSHNYQISSFKGIIIGSDIDLDKKLVNVLIMSRVKTENKRGNKRFHTYAPVNIYDDIGDKVGALLSEGEINDISLEATNVTLHNNVPLTEGDRAMLNFVLFRKCEFNLPATVLYRKNIAKGVIALPNFVFVFDFNGREKERNRLVCLLFDRCAGK